jgi:hypothetical protein
MSETDAAGAAGGEVGESQNRQGPIQVLLRLVSTARMYRSGDGGLHAEVPIRDRYEVYGIKSAGFRDWLIDGYFAERSEPPSAWAITRVVSLLRARARFDGGLPSVHIRVGRNSDQEGSAYFVDLGDASRAAIKVSAQGWDVVDRPDVQFQRPAGMLALPVPRRGGSIARLRPYLNVSDNEFRLTIAWLTMALRPVGPYPILSLHSDQGSAKSTLARILGLLIDPQVSPLLDAPASARDLMVTAVNGWLLAYDNITTIPDWLSDGLCRLVYGGGFAGRALFSDKERCVIHAQRPVILNGIDDFVRKSDLPDRAVFLHQPPITQNRRRAEAEFWSEFRGDYPQILGAALDAVVGGLRELPSVHLTRLPRMADFALWGEAVGRGLGWQPGEFYKTYEENRSEASVTSLEGSPLGSMLLAVAKSILNWECSPEELLNALTEKVGRKVARSAAWPKSTRSLMSELRRLAPQLRIHGLSIRFGRNREGVVMTVVTAGFLVCVGEFGQEGDSNAVKAS